MDDAQLGLPDLSNGLSASPSLPASDAGNGDAVVGDVGGGGIGVGDVGGDGGGGLFWGGGGGGSTNPLWDEAVMGHVLAALSQSNPPTVTSNGSTSNSSPQPTAPPAAAFKSASPMLTKRWWLIALAIGLLLLAVSIALNYS
jgi:hypothetical protein